MRCCKRFFKIAHSKERFIKLMVFNLIRRLKNINAKVKLYTDRQQTKL